jgi:hypothetical protein
MAIKILSEQIKVNKMTSFDERLNNREVINTIVEKLFIDNTVDEGSYLPLCDSIKLLNLSVSAFNISRIIDSEEKKKAVYFNFRKLAIKEEIEKYMLKEKIPTEFAQLVQNKNCLQHLLGFFLKVHLQKSFTEELLRPCTKLSTLLIKNTELETPYNRTSQFRDFLYQVCKNIKGDDSELKIPSKLIRIILSTSRLHLSIMDESNLSVSELTKVIQKQQSAFNQEQKKGEVDFIKENSAPSKLHKQFIKNWKCRHLFPVLLGSDCLSFLAKLSTSDKYLNLKLVLFDSQLFQMEEISKLDLMS